MKRESTRGSKRRRQHKLQLESLENRICLTASVGWDGPGKGAATLTYTVGTAPAAVGQANFEAAIETALKAWSDVADVNFVETTRTGLDDSIDFTFRDIDGKSGVLAQAYLPDDVNRSRIAGDVQFDAAESWEIGNARGGRATDLVWVAVHEIGHSLGLEHEHGHDHDHGHSVLAPSVSPHQSFQGLGEADIDAVLELYAANNSVPTPTLTPVAPVVPASSGASVPGTGVGSDSGVADPPSNDDSSSEDTSGSDNDADEERRRRRRPWSNFGWRSWNRINYWRVQRWLHRFAQNNSSVSSSGESSSESTNELANESDSNRNSVRPSRFTWVVRVRRWR